jgi:branched-chain amino acid transport system permease protein
MSSVPYIDDETGLYNRVTNHRLNVVYYFVFVLIFPAFVGFRFGAEFLIYGIFAFSFNLLFGRSGLLSFGHALFFGLGAYTAALVVLNSSLPLLGVFVLVLIVALVVSLVIGLISLRLSGVYFAMITLAFAQLFFELAFSLREISGGEVGLTGVTRPSLLGVSLFRPSEPSTFYLLTAIITLLFLIFGYRLSRSPYGRALQGIKENEERTRALGVNTYLVKVGIFAISGMMASVAGALWAFYLRYVNANVFFWENSGDAVIYSIVGGIESLFGPFLGATTLRMLEQNVFETNPGMWNIFLGVVFLTFVLFLQDGIFGLITNLPDRVRDQFND